MGVALPMFNLGVRWGVRSTPRTGRFTPEKEMGTHFTGDWRGGDPRICNELQTELLRSPSA